MNLTSVLLVAPSSGPRTRMISPPEGAMVSAVMRCVSFSEIVSTAFLIESPVAALIFETTFGEEEEEGVFGVMRTCASAESSSFPSASSS